MSRRGKFFQKLMSGTSGAAIDFQRLCELLRWLGFREHIRGDHHIFSKPGVVESIDLQPEGKQAKAY